MIPLPVLQPEWPAPARVQALCTTRQGGVSTGAWKGLNVGAYCGDNAQAVAENRRLLREHLSLPSEPAWLRQVHGTRVVALPADVSEPEADAAFSTVPETVCAVLTAECLPGLFCVDAGTVVAAALAGWRGLAAGVLEATVAALPASPSRLMAWMGPAIGPDAFEVGEEVHAAFVSHDARAQLAFRAAQRPDHHFADLFLLARQRLEAAGVSRVFGGGISTYADDRRFYSHRRDRVTGRQAAMIWLKT